jgi:hypothetical protein
MSDMIITENGELLVLFPNDDAAFPKLPPETSENLSDRCGWIFPTKPVSDSRVQKE